MGGGSVDVYPDIGEISPVELVAGHLGVAFQVAVAYGVVAYPGTLGPAGELFPDGGLQDDGLQVVVPVVHRIGHRDVAQYIALEQVQAALGGVDVGLYADVAQPDDTARVIRGHTADLHFAIVEGTKGESFAADHEVLVVDTLPNDQVVTRGGRVDGRLYAVVGRHHVIGGVAREAGPEETEEEKGASYGSHDMVNCFRLKLGQGMARINRKPEGSGAWHKMEIVEACVAVPKRGPLPG